MANSTVAPTSSQIIVLRSDPVRSSSDFWLTTNARLLEPAAGC